MHSLISYILLDDNIDQDKCYIDSIFRRQPELLLFDQQQLELENITITKFNTLLKEHINYDLSALINGCAGMGMLMGKPFILYLGETIMSMFA